MNFIQNDGVFEWDIIYMEYICISSSIRFCSLCFFSPILMWEVSYLCLKYFVYYTFLVNILVYFKYLYNIIISYIRWFLNNDLICIQLQKYFWPFNDFQNTLFGIIFCLFIVCTYWILYLQVRKGSPNFGPSIHPKKFYRYCFVFVYIKTNIYWKQLIIIFLF